VTFRTRRVAAAAAAVIMLATGAIVALTTTARAGNAVPLVSCTATGGAGTKCTLTGSAANVEALYIGATAPGPSILVNAIITVTCSAAGQTQTWTGGGEFNTPFNIGLSGGDFTSSDLSCQVSGTASNVGSTSGSFTATVTYIPYSSPQPSASPSPSASLSPSSPSPSTSSVHLVRGFDGMCVRDMGDSAAARTKVVAWACDPTAQGQGWTYRGDELRIHGSMCVTAKGSGTSGSPVLLWPCDGGRNEIWAHRSGGEYALKAGGYKLCLTDPGFATANGTQLVVLACTDARDQRWSLP
jgi:Ricin-type beta-trefoil lectin domain